ncbi:glycerate kinase [Thalassospira sp. HF15]|uniref:glycerate kinase type-2 family protein n=1 Tax=Thalassospira sp. HF15 TaxID=2722755 RepID=UPI00158B7B20|nr:glycerate kinase [Thalassospira sp. HF15]
MTAREKLLRMMDAALTAADPTQCMADHLPEKPKGRTIVIGAGKASAKMAQAFERYWKGEVGGLVITRYGHAVPCQYVEIVEAGHPVPNEAGRVAAKRVLELVSSATKDDLIVCMISGGGSSLLAMPAEGIKFSEKQQIGNALLRSGATISEMNCVRKHLSGVKGGRLAAAAGKARMITYLVSDVPGDDPSIIASGPTVPDDTTGSDALRIIDAYGINLSDEVRGLLSSEQNPTVSSKDPCFTNSELVMLTTPQASLLAAASVARELGVAPIILGDAIEGEAREIAIMHAGIAQQVLRHDQPVPKPCVLLSGGETSVTVSGEGGRGGRNSEFLLSLMMQFRGQAGLSALAIDTDGIDGSEDNAGALIDESSWRKAVECNVDLHWYLQNHDSYSAFDQISALITTGPTLTNVNDFRCILIE